MTVSFSSGNYSADFMAAGTGSSQRVETRVSGGSQFAEMLGSQGSGNSQNSGVTGSVNSSGAVKPDGAADIAAEGSVKLEGTVDADVTDKVMEAADSIDVAELENLVIKEQTVALPKDTMELAKAIVNGEIDIKDVPAERLTFELLKAIIMMRFKKKLDEDKKAIDPDEESKDQTNTSAQVDLRLAILYKIIDAYVEANNDDPSKSTEGILTRIQEVSELMEEQGREADLTAVLAQLINDRIEALSSENGATAGGNSTEVSASEQEFFDELAEAIGEDNAKLLEQAVKDGEVEQVEKVLRKITSEAKEQPRTFDAKPVVNREVSEELEMLRNAKQSSARNTGDEFAKITETDGEAVKVVTETQNADNNAKSDTNAGADNGAKTGNGAGVAVTEGPIIFRAEDGAEIKVQPSEVVSQAMKLVEQAIQDTAEQTEYSLTLNPGELGRITVRMIKAADGAVSVTIAAENAQTQRILETNSALMQNNLRDNGVQLESWQTVSESQQETLAQDYNGSSKNPYYRKDESADEEQQPDVSFADLIAAM